MSWSIESTARKLVGIAFLLLALAQVLVGVVYLTEDLMGWNAERLPRVDRTDAADPAPGETSGGPVSLAVCLLLGAPLLMGGGLVLFRERGRYLVEGAGALAILCGGLGLWWTPQWPVYVAGVLVGVSAVYLARGLPHSLPRPEGKEDDESSSPGQPSEARTREPYDRGDKLLVGLIAASVLGLLLAIFWGG